MHTYTSIFGSTEAPFKAELPLQLLPLPLLPSGVGSLVVSPRDNKYCIVCIAFSSWPSERLVCSGEPDVWSPCLPAFYNCSKWWFVANSGSWERKRVILPSLPFTDPLPCIIGIKVLGLWAQHIKIHIIWVGCYYLSSLWTGDLVI